MTARKLGSDTVRRAPALSEDDVTLDAVIHDAMAQCEAERGLTYDLVVTAQPTAPLLLTETLDAAIDHALANQSIDTLISAIDDRHLSWVERDGELVPAYTERLNRQYLPARYRETGGFFIARRRVVTPRSRFGKQVAVWPVSTRESIDIDTAADWALCEYYLNRKRIVLVTTGYPEVGLGHVYNLLAIAANIVGHELLFVVDRSSPLARDTIASYNYRVLACEDGPLADFVLEQRPDVIINDRLDTDLPYMERLRTAAVPLVNFEDLGPGSRLADLVVNAMYPEREELPGHYYGPRYFCLRSEFTLTEESVTIRDEVRRVLITFGGVDPNNLTRRVLALILPECRRRGIAVSVILGRGYAAHHSLREFGGEVDIQQDVADISERMSAADLAFTSAGRTTFETASLGLPTIVLCQNERETTHFFAREAYGFRNLGLATAVRDAEVIDTFVSLLDGAALRREMSRTLLRQEVKKGITNVLQLIEQEIRKA